jgi:hypothetical protein
VLALLVAVVVSTARVGDGALDLCDSASGTGDDVAGVTERSPGAARECVLAVKRCFVMTKTLCAAVDAMTRLGY